MRQMRNVIMVGATFLLAAATGHVMQTTAEDGLYGAGASLPRAAAASLTITGAQIASVAELPQLSQRAIAPDLGAPALPRDVSATVGFSGICAPADLKVQAVEHALLQADVHAPCLAGQPVEVAHEGLRFTAVLDGQGEWHGLLPALATQAVVTVQIAGGAQIGASVAVPGVEAINRIVLSWQGAGDMHLNVFERGAGFGDAGHIHAAAPRTPDTPLGGYLLAYGDLRDGARAEVYTAPATMTDLRFELDAPVGQHSCGRDLGGALQRVLAATAEPAARLILSLPDCSDAGGDVVMALPDLPVSVAAN